MHEVIVLPPDLFPPVFHTNTVLSQHTTNKPRIQEGRSQCPRIAGGGHTGHHAP